MDHVVVVSDKGSAHFLGRRIQTPTHTQGEWSPPLQSPTLMRLCVHVLELHNKGFRNIPTLLHEFRRIEIIINESSFSMMTNKTTTTTMLGNLLTHAPIQVHTE